MDSAPTQVEEAKKFFADPDAYAAANPGAAAAPAAGGGGGAAKKEEKKARAMLCIGGARVLVGCVCVFLRKGTGNSKRIQQGKP